MSDSFISLAIEQMDPTNFELWCQEVLSNDKGYTFEPTGGIHDGGQDGFMRIANELSQHYVQISTEKDTSSKIRRTIRRLRSTRNFDRLTYVTSQIEAERDLLEAKLKQDLGVDIVIHDKRWLLIQAQLNDVIKASLFAYSKDLIDGLSKVQNTERRLNFSSRLSIVSYLEAHVRSIPGTENFQNICLDTLIYNILIDTDPDLSLFVSANEILATIQDEHPNVLSKTESTLQDRLDFLSSKANDPRIRKHPEDNYALPFSVRNSFNEGNLRINGAEDAFVGGLNTRLNEEQMENVDSLRPYVISCVRDALVETFRTQAMNFAASFSSRDFDSDIRVYEIIASIIEELDVPADLKDVVSEASSAIFRHVCYSSSEEEREYLNLLLKFFTIQFVMDGDNAVAKYFSDMAQDLRIYVGTDIIVRCLSEELVQNSSKGMTNSLNLLTSAGVRLRVTRQTLSEVFFHIRLSTHIFRTEYESWFRHAELDQVINCDRILIRSFFYAFLEPSLHTKKPRDWSDYLRNFGAAAWFAKTDELTSEEYLDEFGSFLVDKYGLEFVEIDEVLEKIDNNLAKSITEEILKQRDTQTDGSRILAMNDAQMALFINSERNSRRERVSTNLYGFNTWWLTEETAVLKALQRHEQKTDVVMHPQFLMNHFILDPRFMKSNQGEDRKITPTLFGLRITDRVPASEMKGFLRGIGDLAGLSEAAQRARIRRASNALKRGGARNR